MQKRRFEGQVAMITGASGGIGRAISKEFAREGATMVLTDVKAEALEEIARFIENEHVPVLRFVMDVTNEEEVAHVVEQVIASLKKIDILVNNAGVSTMNWFWKVTQREWNFNMDVNAKGVWLASKYVAPHLIRRKCGKIVNVASMAGKIGSPLLAHYSASKFAVVGFTQAAAMELAAYGINVNAVCPGFVGTPMQDREIMWQAELQGVNDPKKIREEYIAETPLGRLCYPSDVAKVVSFLASEDADFMTGQAINVSGGICMQ